MSSNCADPDTDVDPAPPKSPHSLALWFTVCNSLLAFLVLGLISVLLYLGLNFQLENQNRRYLRDEVRMLVEVIDSTHRAGPVFTDHVDPAHYGEEYVKHYVRLLDGNGAIVAETRGMAQAAPRARFVPPGDGGSPGVETIWHNSDGCVFLGTSVRVELDDGSGEYGILEVALDVTNVDSILAGYRIKICGALLLGLIVSVMGSLAIARRGTRPLREMADMVRGVSVSTLNQRICAARWWPSEFHTLASATNNMLGRLEDSFARLHNTAKNLSHKIRTPLTILRGEAEVALSRDRSVEELQDVIVSGLEENNRLVRLVDNILFLSDAELGKIHASSTLIDAAAELEKVIDFYSPAAEERGITVRLVGSAELHADAALLRKAVAALVSNALTYNDEGGWVELELNQGEGDSSTVRVSDSGCGVPESEREKIFDRFYRIYATRYRDPHGTGLGLSIAKTIMDLHLGSIAIESVPGERTTVSLVFPAPPA